jgi:hypothetical protein
MRKRTGRAIPGDEACSRYSRVAKLIPLFPESDILRAYASCRGAQGVCFREANQTVRVALQHDGAIVTCSGAVGVSVLR